MRRLLLILLLTATALGADRYIDQDSGNDTTGDGTSSNPWKTIAKVNTLSDTEMDAGETIYLDRADTWAETLTLDSMDLANIIVDGNTFDPGTIGSGKALLNGDVARPILINHALTGLTIKGLDFSGQDWQAGFGISCEFDLQTNLTLESLTSNGHLNYGAVSLPKDMIFIGSNCAGTTTVKSCTLYNGGYDPIKTKGAGITETYGVILGQVDTGTYNIHDNTMYNFTADAIRVNYTAATVNIYNNTLYNCGEDCIDLLGANEGIELYISIYDNDFYRNSFTGGWGLPGNGRCSAIHVGGSPSSRSQYVKIYDNHIHDADFLTAINVTEGDYVYIYNNTIEDANCAIWMNAPNTASVYNNIILNIPGQWAVSPGQEEVAIMGFSSNAKVYHNSIYGPSGIHWEDGTVWAYVKNNIVHVTDGDQWPFRSYSGAYSRPRDMVVENNNWFNSGSSKRVKWGLDDGPTNYEFYADEVSAWQALAGDVGDNAIFTDPLYHSVGNDDVNLTDSSPGKDTGLDLDIDTDYTGASRIGNHDMGALEFDPNPAVPGAATSPSPSDAATGQDINVDISWTADDDADDHDVYFGTSPSNVGDANVLDTQFKGNQAGVTYNPGTLEYATPYYWRIDEVNDTLPATTKGAVWTFTTKTAASGAAGWYNASWLYRKKIIIQPANVDSDLTNFPLNVPISSDTDIGAGAKSDGSDIRFTAADGQTLLDFHMPYWDITASVANANIFVECDPNDSSPAAAWIYIYYGNAAASDDQDEAGTWDASYAGVWHLDETAGAAVDSDGTNDGTYTVDLPDEQAGILYYCQDFDGVGDYVDLGSTISVADQDFTVSAWFKTTDATVGGIFSNFQSGAGDEWFALAVNASGGMDEDAGDIGFGIDDAGTKQGAETTGAGYNDNAWHHICGKREGTNLELFVDGGSVDVNAIGAYGDIDGTLAPRIGTFGNIGDTHSFIGQIDEVRISTTARHDDWIKFEYYNIFNGDNELDWGLEEVDAAPGSKNMIIIIGA